MKIEVKFWNVLFLKNIEAADSDVARLKIFLEKFRYYFLCKKRIIFPPKFSLLSLISDLRVSEM